MAEAKNVTQINISESGMSSLSKGMRLNEIRTAIPELEAACNAAIERAEIFTDLCKLVGLKANVDGAVVKTFISARCKDSVQKTEDKAQQLEILFSEIA